MSDRIIERAQETAEGFRLKFRGHDTELNVPLSIYQKHRLTENIVITQAQLAQLQHEVNQMECAQAARRLLAARAHSEGDLRAKLSRKGYAKEVIQAVLRELKVAGLIDDDSYALNFARKLIERNPSGHSFLVAALRKMRISPEVAKQAVDLAMSSQDEESLAERSLRRRWHVFREFDIERARAKAYTYLSRRGIGYSAARAAFTKLYSESQGRKDDTT